MFSLYEVHDLVDSGDGRLTEGVDLGAWNIAETNCTSNSMRDFVGLAEPLV